MRRVLILGATSAIAEAVARNFARRGDALCIAGRSAERLAAISTDLTMRGAAKVVVAVDDLSILSNQQNILNFAIENLAGIDAALVAYGTLSNQHACSMDINEMSQEIHNNATSVMAWCTALANHFEAQHTGVLAVISSVAGDRGRKSNYVYGAAKAAVSCFTSGLRQRLRGSGVSVVTVKPGFVDTPMTKTFKKGILWVAPESVANRIVFAMIHGKSVIYTPRFWYFIMALIKIVPERLFMRLSM